MPDRYAFTSPFGKEPEPWFKVKNYGISTTLGIIALAIASMVWRTVEGRPFTLSVKLLFDPSSISEGQIWRIFTWPFFNEPHILLALSLFFFYILGTQLENILGKKPYLLFVCSVITLPALLTLLISLLLPDAFTLNSFGGVEKFMTGIIVAYAANKPRAMFFFSIPAWVLAAVIVAIDLMQTIGNEFWMGTTFTLLIVAIALITLRALGYAAAELDWIPQIPLGSLVNDTPTSQPQKNRKRKKQNLYAVPTPLEEAEMNTILDQIADKGYKSLSSEQKKRLKKYSKNMRNRGNDL